MESERATGEMNLNLNFKEKFSFSLTFPLKGNHHLREDKF